MAPLRIGLVFELLEPESRRPEDPIDAHVEYEPESTIEALEHAIAQLGHQPVRLGSPRALLTRLGQGRPPLPDEIDVAFNLAEGAGSRNREAWAPVLLEMAGIPTIGSDALTLSLSLDKAWTNRWVSAAGIPVAPQTLFGRADEARAGGLPAAFPLFVKPRWEGTAKGIRPSSKVHTRPELVREVERITRDYRQPALVEAFLPGAEYTVTIVGNTPPRALPAVQRALELETGIGLHALEGPESPPRAGYSHRTPGVLEPALEARLAALAIRAFEALECRDFARVDFRLDAAGEPVFLEINPLPTFATDGTFAILAELEGISLDTMLGRCVAAGLARLGMESKPGGDEGGARE